MSEKERNDKDSTKSDAITQDPGASRYGNFMNYYKFHSAEERARQLPRGVWLRPTFHRDRKYIGLDVGCNAGDLTLLLQKFLQEEIQREKTTVHLLGVDLDPILIERARENNLSHDLITFEHLDFMSKNRDTIIQKYLEKFSRERFDVIFSFSITMWIHVNHGDAGLIDYLETICSFSDMIVIEPQSWKCYRNASRRLRRAGADDFPLLNSLLLNGDVTSHIDRIITKRCSFARVTVTDANEWGRKLLIYERTNHTG